MLGNAVGDLDGPEVGGLLGFALGSVLGYVVGSWDGTNVELEVGCKEGIEDVGEYDGKLDGFEECSKLGCNEGIEVGEAEIWCVGESDVVGGTEGAVVNSTRL